MSLARVALQARVNLRLGRVLDAELASVHTMAVLQADATFRKENQPDVEGFGTEWFSEIVSHIPGPTAANAGSAAAKG